MDFKSGLKRITGFLCRLECKKKKNGKKKLNQTIKRNKRLPISLIWKLKRGIIRKNKCGNTSFYSSLIFFLIVHFFDSFTGFVCSFVK